MPPHGIRSDPDQDLRAARRCSSNFHSWGARWCGWDLSVHPDAMTATACRDAFAEAVRSFDLASRVAEALSRVPRPQGRAVIVAAGKSAASMLAGAVRWS